MRKADLLRIQRCENQLHDFMEDVLHGIASDSLSKRTIEGKWSALEHLAHLGRYHEIFLDRLGQMLTVENPEFARYRAEDDPGWELWRALRPDQVTMRITALRQQLLRQLKSLTESDFVKTGEHPRFGCMTISVWIEFFLVHEGHHLYFVLQQARTLQT